VISLKAACIRVFIFKQREQKSLTHFYLLGKMVNAILSDLNIQGGMFHKVLTLQLDAVRNIMEYPDQEAGCFSPP